MRQAYSILPVYSGDVSGVCSSLYELDGMVVMHDPSGCNSTYNTHDEIRWYDKESLIFLTGLTERDAILGNDEKLIRDVVDAAETFKPRFIALANSPIPYINGTDFKGISHIIEKKTGIPTFHVSTNAMHDYTRGSGEAYLEFAKKLLKPSDIHHSRSVNILGMTPLDFTHKDSVTYLRQWLKDHNFTVQSCWSMGDDLDTVLTASRASLNLVISSTGLKVAQYMEEVMGIPYVCGVPIGSFAEDVYNAMERVLETKVSEVSYLRLYDDYDGIVLGEPIVSGSLARAYEKDTGKRLRIVSTTEHEDILLSDKDTYTRGEEEVKQVCLNQKIVMGDPLYHYVCQDCHFIEIPHFAFSGRLYLKQIPLLMTIDWRNER